MASVRELTIKETTIVAGGRSLASNTTPQPGTPNIYISAGEITKPICFYPIIPVITFGWPARRW
jgi:hypothetical protein